ncbi:MAG: GNAT family protein [Acidocella sp.]|nr:GNAT family protein [Acidocella sp.]
MTTSSLPEIIAVPLRHALVRLEPLSVAHHDGLVAAVRDGEMWRLWYTSVPSPEGMATEIARRLKLAADGMMAPFAVLDGAGRVVGMTNYMNIDTANRRVEIGSTWYARVVHKTGLNTAAKWLLLGHAFEELGCVAVEFRTHFFNHQSRRAIERLGAKLDGILRCHTRGPNGEMRDTCVYSIIAPEWPAVRTHLAWQLEKPR